MINLYNKISWQSPSNIAIVKYWGKHGKQLPNNASLSMTLKKAVTKTTMYYQEESKIGTVEYYFEGSRNVAFEERVVAYIKSLYDEMPFLVNMTLRFDSENSFPHSTGIASSASSMSALALCLVSLEEKINKVDFKEDEFYQRASYIARLASGSASRSVYGGWVSWGVNSLLVNSSSEYATRHSHSIHEKFQRLGDAVLIVSSKKKSVSSSLGHQLMENHPYASARYKQAEVNFNDLINAISLGNFELFAKITETEALALHSLLMTSSENGLLLKPNSLAIIEKVREFRKSTGCEICFTLDAGPNLHLFYNYSYREKVLQFINNELLVFCENATWIDDETGFGPIQL